ncbi:hypothetical protein Nepgr_019840 [Nepenthes gracilis]|uniref:Uncharacterized protein n=1 Tax=Nepenthes gracilis TaxID=150966 RepID=A0AAD3XVF7_NEPGR|nr:hypothetical protein Nepgr_019840 [Nepenthes gracilis]
MAIPEEGKGKAEKVESGREIFRERKGRPGIIPEADRHRRGKDRLQYAATVKPPLQSRVHLKTLLRVTSIACGIQFGWALQLSLLTPYVQELGISHAWASIVWLCGPLSGFFVQPLVGHMSDRCNSRFGRRRPFILGGAVMIAVSVLIVGHSADIGYLLYDRGEKRPMAVVAFVVGFWLLDVANNTTQGPCRALLADLTGKDHRRNRVANAYFSLFMAVGNVLGFATGSYSGWYRLLPFTVTQACSANCANLKSAFFIDIACIAITTSVSISAYKELPLSSGDGSTAIAELSEGSSTAQEAFLWELFGTFRTASFGYGLPPNGAVIAALMVFTILGIPLAITYSIPYALISARIESLGLGQGLSMGVLNLAIVIPQVVVSWTNSHFGSTSVKNREAQNPCGSCLRCLWPVK